MPRKYLPYYWPFVRAIHLLPAVSPHKKSVIWSFDIFFVVSLNELLDKSLTKGQQYGALIVSFLLAWLSYWTNSWSASDLWSLDIHVTSCNDVPNLIPTTLILEIDTRNECDSHWFHCFKNYHFDGLVQERCNSSALAMELRFSYTIPSICQAEIHIFVSTKVEFMKILKKDTHLSAVRYLFYTRIKL